MKKLDEDNKFHLLLELLMIIMLIIIILLIAFKDNKKDNDTINDSDSISLVDEKILDTEKANEEIKEVIEPKSVMVDVKGAVKKPGVYSVSIDTVVNDVIKAAGGLKSNASTKYINLSKKVTDEMVIIIYTNSEINKMKNPVIDVCTTNDYKLDNCDNSSIVITDNTSDNKEDKIDKEDNTIKISINTGTKEELMTLSGIGESKALAIIEYRNTNGGFKMIEDLMKVTGIGESVYNKIKDNIKL